jgi:CubicO group peptidase (beta-lactamase class C family)
MKALGSSSMQVVGAFCVILAVLLPGTPAYSGEARKELVQGPPGTVGLLASRLEQIDDAVGEAMEAGEIPGAVVLVARHGQIAYLKAFGNRSVQPRKEVLTTDTIFDMSSLTKVLATLPLVLMLVEDGVLRLEDRVKRYLPEFTGGGKDNITLRHLLTHYSGLPADFDLSKDWFGYRAALAELYKTNTNSEPGKEFVYGDLNFIALGEAVQSVTGKKLDEYARERIFVPLGMTDTFFRPPAGMNGRIAPTEPRRNTLQYLKGKGMPDSADQILRGEVHDPTAWRMGGVAGHAGLFSSARDVAIFAQMLLDQGAYAGGRLLSPLTVQSMTRPQSPRDGPQIRGYGWDIDSLYSSPRGDIFREGYGHTGFTGTSLWVHPPTDVFIIVLSSRLHPGGGRDINHLRAVIANIVAAAVADPH